MINKVGEDSLKSVYIEAINAAFDPQSGQWRVSRSDEDIQGILKQEIEKQLKIEARFYERIAVKDYLLNKTRREIEMILSDHAANLENQGFPAKQLLSNLSSKKVLDEL